MKLKKSWDIVAYLSLIWPKEGVFSLLFQPLSYLSQLQAHATYGSF